MKTAKKLRLRRGSSKRKSQRGLYRQNGGQSTTTAVSSTDGDNIIYAGGGTSRGYVNGTLLDAKFNEPWGITMDPVGNIYIADKANNCIRKIRPENGAVQTFAGVQDDATNILAKIKVPVNPGYVNGQATTARLRRPQGIVCDTDSNLYVVETDNHVVRKIDSRGNVTTFAGPPATPANSGGQSIKGFVNGTSETARFNQPFGITIDSKKNLYVADNQNHAIRKIDASGNVTTFAGGSSGNTDGTGTAAKFKFPYGVACDSSDNVYVADYMNGAIRKITPAGVVTTIAGGTGLGYADGIKTAAKLRPVGITIGPNNKLFVSDGDPEKNAPAGTAHRIRIVDTTTGRVTTFAGNGTQTPSTGISGTNALNTTFSNPTCMLYVPRNKRLYVVNTGTLNPPSGNPFLGNYISIITDGSVKLIAGSGTAAFADGTGPRASFYFPSSISTDKSGNIFVADNQNHRIRKVTPGGVVTTIAGNGTESLPGEEDDGTAANSTFSYPFGLAVDASGNVIVADTPYKLRKITPDGAVTTLAGGDGGGSTDGPGSEATFNTPFGIAIDNSGNYIVTEARNNLIRKVTPSGVVTTLAGIRGEQGFSDGQAEAAKFSTPLGIVVDKLGNIFVADSGNYLIRKITPSGVVSTFAGGGGNSIPDGTGTNASFMSISNMAIDSSNNIFLVNSSAILKVTPNAVVTTLFNRDELFDLVGDVTSIAIDASDNMFVAGSNNKIYRIKY